MAELVRSVRVRLVSNDEKEEQGEVKVREWTAGDRKRRGLKALGICWGLAIVTLFIPLAHFFLVPAFLIAGPVVASYVYGQTDLILGGGGICPACKEAFEVVRTQPHWPVADVCAKCHAAVKVIPLETG